jgi:hypothetical protein
LSEICTTVVIGNDSPIETNLLISLS